MHNYRNHSFICLLIAVVALLISPTARAENKVWLYAQLSTDDRFGEGELQWDKETVHQGHNEPDKILRAIGGQPLPNADVMGSGFFLVVQTMGKQGWELISVIKGADTSNYVFKKEGK